jgi:hypothetical protein
VTTCIDIQNNAEIHAFILAKLLRIGWKINPNAALGNWMWGKYPNQTPRNLCLSYQYKELTWLGEGSIGYDHVIDVIETIEDARQLMEFVEQNTESFVEELENPCADPSLGMSYYQYGLKSGNGKTMVVAPSHNYLNEINELTQKCDTVIGIKAAPKKKSTDISWDMDALDAKLGAIYSEKLYAMLNNSLDKVWQQKLSSYFSKKWDEDYYGNSPFSKLIFGKKEHPMDVGGEL